MGGLPTGTVTFLFTDVEGSTRLWEAHPAPMRAALSRHDALIEQAVERHGGVVVRPRGEGDSRFAVFARATDAVAAAAAIQQALHTEPWPPETPLRVRLALHTGEADLRDGDYYGSAVNRCARLRSIAHGGQTLLSMVTEELVRDALPPEVGLREVGEHRLADLIRPERVFQLLHPALPAAFPPLRSLDTFPHNLPLQLTSFVGRDHELAEVRRLLQTTRLVTLTGTGGCGKTRLALQAAADLLPAYPAGVWLVDLAPLADPALVPATVATAVGVREAAGQPLLATLVGALHPRHLLLLLDNCEHLVEACAQLVDAVLRGCPRVQVLATSREALGIAGETPWRVPSLPQPPPDAVVPPERLVRYDAVRLFLDRAVAARPGFAVTNQNAPAVAQVCWRLDGIPLAIELAAARVRALGAEQLAGRLDDRFRLLTGGSRTALPRQQTLQATVAWSHDLLTEAERRFFARLAVFAGGWTLEAAEEVCAGEGVEGAEVLDLLTRLLDKSLVVAEAQAPAGDLRYRLLETLRQYARQRLAAGDGAEATRRRHAAYYLAVAERAAEHQDGADQDSWLLELEVEHDNLRAALGWASATARGAGEATGADEADRGPAGASPLLTAWRLAAALFWFWFLRGHWREMDAALDELIALPVGTRPAAVATRAQLLGLAGFFSLQGGRAYEWGRRLVEESLALYTALGDRREILRARSRLEEDPARRRRLWEEVLALDRVAGDRRATAETLYYLAGDVAYGRAGAPDPALARVLYTESLHLRQTLGDRLFAAQALSRLGFLAREEGDPAGALPLLEESLATFRQMGNQFHVAWALRNLGNAAGDLGDRALARARFREAVAIEGELGYTTAVATSLEMLAGLDVAEGRPDRAIRLAGAAAALRGTDRGWRSPRDQAQLERDLALAREVLGEPAAAAAWNAGQRMTPKQAVAYALEAGAGG
jgi:predicted ATPase/class 3 adenylate cyclase